MTPFEQRVCHKIEEGLGQVRVLVLGDYILDRYCFGEVERISPEAPVPVLRVTREKCVPGGAGNVVSNLSGLGAGGIPLGLVGKDPEGTCLLDLLERLAVSIDGMECFLSRPTSRKTRVVAERQQMIRLDREETSSILPEESSILLDSLRETIPLSSAVILSDYGKGVCSGPNCKEVIAQVLSAGLPVIVDPKGADWEKYRGATWVTPNLKELAQAAGLSKLPNEDGEVVRIGRQVRQRFGLSNLLVTRSEAGMTLISDGNEFHVRSVAREVFDVSGAGDTVVATLAVFIGCGFSEEEAVRLANIAAGIVVGKSGTRPVLVGELAGALRGREPGVCSVDKILGMDEVCRRVQEWKAEGLKVVATNGCFDLLHPGHVTYLEEAARLGDRLVVALNSDGSVRRLKGDGRPVNTEIARARVLAGLSSVDMACVFEEDTPFEVYRQMKPDVICKGGDYSPDEVAGGEFARQVVILPFLEGHSTTGIMKRIEKGKAEGLPAMPQGGNKNEN